MYDTGSSFAYGIALTLNFFLMWPEYCSFLGTRICQCSPGSPLRQALVTASMLLRTMAWTLFSARVRNYLLSQLLLIFFFVTKILQGILFLARTYCCIFEFPCVSSTCRIFFLGVKIGYFHGSSVICHSSFSVWLKWWYVCVFTSSAQLSGVSELVIIYCLFSNPHEICDFYMG